MSEFSHEPTVNIMEAITPIEPPSNSACDIPYETVDEANENENLISNDDATRLNNEKLIMPSQVSPPSWLEEEMMNIDTHNVSTTYEESKDMPSQPSELNTKLVHYFVENGPLEEDPIQHEVLEEANNGGQSVVPNVESQVSCPGEHGIKNQILLGAFLKLLVERVKASSRNSTIDYHHLRRSSQLFTSEYYMKLLFDSEHKKKKKKKFKKPKRERRSWPRTRELQGLQ